MGSYHQALPLYQRALKIMEQAQGPKHPNTASGLNNLAGMYETLGAYDQALPLYQRALGIYEKALGPEYRRPQPDSTTWPGCIKPWAPMTRPCPCTSGLCRSGKKSVGPEHPATAISLTNLAVLYEYLGAYDQALPLQQRAMKRYQKVRPQHPTPPAASTTWAGSTRPWAPMIRPCPCTGEP